MDAAGLEECKKRLEGIEGLAASAVRAALIEMQGGNLQFGRGLHSAIEDLPDADDTLKSIAKELEAMAG